eukprot:GEMP01031589.1.p1 GENE.GEMP01031589.1~~GEMP01031589.1.p1  ORF type:complete len:508 (+),score=88.90 GEMP01031589.1:182-1705(+)
MAYNRDEAFYTRATTVVGANFLVLFAGFNASQSLQTSIHGKILGNISLCVLYSSFTLFSLITPMMLRALEDKLAQKWQFIIGALPYIVMILSNNIKFGDSFRPTWILFVFLNACVGMGAPIVWTAQTDFIGRCAAKISESCGENLSLTSSRLNAQFFGFFQFSGMIGSLVSGLVLLLAGTEAVFVLFNILGVFMSLSIIGFFFLPTVSKSAVEEAHPVATVGETLSLAFVDNRTGLCVPITICNGMMLGFFNAEFTATFICPVASQKMVGFVLAMFFTSNGFMTLLWGHFLGRGSISRANALAIAAALQVILLCALLVIQTVGFNPTYVMGHQSWNKVPGMTIQVGQVALLFVGAFIYAAGDSVYESQVPAIFQTLYVNDAKSTAAYANYKMWQSLGFAMQFGIGSTVPQFAPKALALLLLHVVSLGMIFVLNKRHPFDTQNIGFAGVDRRNATSQDSHSLRMDVECDINRGTADTEAGATNRCGGMRSRASSVGSDYGTNVTRVAS